ncbi:AAA family ATPase [Shumkonia mesophila]|uniref:AAA family ATPase n=1 Tax=Shumkonia mesophila TaxID=2838854 RepID=UPI00293503FF|nr:AAA family ATPase [Shumkonia mesophila]
MAKRGSSLNAPFLRRLSVVEERVEKDSFPFNRLPYLARPDFSLGFSRRVTFLVGENGAGKSTLLEAIAALCDFPAGGGSQDHWRIENEDPSANRLIQALRPEWLPRVRSGFYLRAESFFNLAAYIDDVGDIDGLYGGRKMHAQSHGESVLALLAHRLRSMGRGIILMDEPEAALSPSSQMAFLGLLREWDRLGTVQVIVATHSPIIMCYPDATLFWFDGQGIAETTAEQTEHYRITKAFLSNPPRYLAEIFDETDAAEPEGADDRWE